MALEHGRNGRVPGDYEKTTFKRTMSKHWGSAFDVDVHISLCVCLLVAITLYISLHDWVVCVYINCTSWLTHFVFFDSSVCLPCPSSDLKSTELPQSHVEAVMWCRPLATFRQPGSPKAAKLDHLVMDHDLAMTRPNMDDIHYSKQHISGSSLPKMNDLVL